MNVSLILTLEATLSLGQVSADSVNFIVHNCNFKYKKKPLFTDERNSKITSVVNFIPSKFGSLPQGVFKVVLHTGLNVYRESSGGSWFVTQSLGVIQSQTRSPSCTNLIFPLHIVYQSAQYRFRITCTVNGLR